MFDLVHPQLCVNDFSGFLYASDEKKILSSLFFFAATGQNSRYAFTQPSLLSHRQRQAWPGSEECLLLIEGVMLHSVGTV